MLLLLAGGCVKRDTALVRASAPLAHGWITTADGRRRLDRLPDSIAVHDAPSGGTIIHVDPTKRYQSITGFGAALTNSSAWLMNRRLTPTVRTALVRELFDRHAGLGFGMVRLTIGASDFSRTHYSFDDRASGAIAEAASHFSTAAAQADVLPLARQARAANPGLLVIASPWSAPGWMKTSNSLITGRLRPDAYAAYAEYLRRTVTSFAAAGVPIFALTIANEPHFEPHNYPGMRMDAGERAAFIGRYLGPALAREQSHPLILDWDHNWDLPNSPLAVLADPAASRFIAGVAWHCYAGDVSAQSRVHDTYPDKDAYFTECTGGGWSPAWGATLGWMTKTLIIGATRNWARGVILWNIALDENGGPHLGGCGNCRGVVTIDSRTGAVTRNVEYYVLGHASRFVHPNARRVATEEDVDGLLSVAFRNVDDRTTALIVFNSSSTARSFTAVEGPLRFAETLPAGAVATFTWPSTDRSFPQSELKH